MKYIYTVLLCLFLAVTNIQADNLTQPFSLVPCPVSLVPGTGNFHFSAKTSFAVENEGQAEQVRQFTGLLTRAAGFTPRIKVDSRKGDICLVTDATLKSEAYKLEITAKKITIRASDLQGFYYGLQSIRQLLPSAIESEQVTENVDWTVPALTITDQPRFGYRGLLVDVARFFSPKENLLRIIDCMAMLKLNKLHLHLVDDNGWRIEIKKYPLLTEIGSCRVDRPGKTFPERRNPRQGEPTVEKGFYTQDEIRIQRLMANRGYTREKCIHIMQNQADRKQFTELADFVIDNSGTVESAEIQIRQILENIGWKHKGNNQ